MIAGFLVLLWLTPFNDIQLSSSLPVDLKLDRLVLPFIVLAWGLAFALGGRGGPQVEVDGDPRRARDLRRGRRASAWS